MISFLGVGTALLFGEVQFSRESGTFVDDVIEIQLEVDGDERQILYSLDGSLPTLESGSVFERKLEITETTQIRARAVLPDGTLGEVSTATFIKVDEELANYSSRLPILIIENLGAGRIPAKGWNGTGAGIRQRQRQPAVWAVIDRGDDGQAKFESSPHMFSRIGIRGRGAFSTTWRQKPYSVEAWQDEDDSERKVAPLDFPEHSDWILYFPDPDRNKDPTLMHNTFMYELSRNAGRYACRFRWVDVFINENGGDLSLSDRRGVYALLEKVSRGKGRLDFERLSADGTSGGWLLNLNRMDAEYEAGWPAPNGARRPQFFHTAGRNRRPETPANAAGRGDDIPRQSNGFLNFDNPNGYRINEEQRLAIEDWFTEFEDVLYDNDQWKHPESGYRSYIDVDDFVTYFAFHNLSRNGDGLLISMFPWKSSRDGRLRMGPAWDYNWNSYDVSGGPTSTAMHRSDRLWYGRLFRDPDFEQAYIDKWFELRRSVMSNEAITAIIEGQAAEIGDEFAESQGFSSAAAWDRARERMIDWLHRRADWLDAHHPLPPVMDPLGGHVEEGHRLGLVADSGAVYYTLDGSDPRLPGGEINPDARELGGTLTSMLVDDESTVYFTVPQDDAEQDSWREAEFDHSHWQSGKGGIGYDSPSGSYTDFIDSDVLVGMRGQNGSMYLRVPFEITALDLIQQARLRVRFDDGFAAFVNGSAVVAVNAPESPQWNSNATASHPDSEAVVFEEFSVNPDLLNLGTNVLAVQAMNTSANGSDFLVEVQLAVDVAQQDSGLIVNESKRITARVLEDSIWSAPTGAQFFVDADVASKANLVVSEVHYHPSDPADHELAPGDPDAENYEFIELLNRGPKAIDLSEVVFSDAIVFDFSDSELQRLPAGERLVIVSREETFRKRYGSKVAVAGEYQGNLSNGGERIEISNAAGVILEFVFDDNPPWPEAPDGDGFSLVLKSPNADPTDSANWTVSQKVGGTPGEDDGPIGLPADLAADNDGDGISALLEYVFGSSDQDANEGRNAFNVLNTPEGLRITTSVNHDLAGVQVFLEESEDLQKWMAITAKPNIEEGRYSWELRDLQGVRFYRLRVELAE